MKIKDIFNAFHDFILELKEMPGTEEYHKAMDDAIDQALSDIRKVILEKLPKQKSHIHTENSVCIICVVNQCLKDCQEAIEGMMR